MEETEITKRERKKLNREQNKSSSPSGSTNKLLVVGAIIAAAAGLFWLMYKGGGGGEAPVPTQASTSPSEVSSNDHAKGPEDAKVTLIEYADFQCPACAAYQPIVKQLSEEFPDDLRVVHRHFPLRSIHKHAQISSQASEAAADQGAFWEMAEILYTRQDDWVNVRDPRSTFKDYASELTLNVEQFDKYMNSDEAKSKVNDSYNAAFVMGLDSTPTFFINGNKIESPRSLDEFREAIAAEISKLAPASPEASSEGEIIPQL